METDSSTTRRLAAAASVLFVGMLVVAPLVGVVDVGAASTSAPPDFEAVSSASNDVPTAQQTGGIGAAADAIASSTLVNRSASTTSVSVTTVAATRGLSTTCAAVDGGPQYCDSPRLAINISDDVAHQGRQVALPRQAVVDAHGEVPDVAYGLHESGERWESSTRVEDDYVIFQVPRFSTNTVSFEGEVSLSMQPAANGASHSYDLSVDSASEYSIDVTGVENREWDNETANSVTPSSSQSVSIAGNLPPEGPSATNSPTISVTVDGVETRTQLTDPDLNEISDVAASGDYAVVVSNANDRLTVLDVSTPESPTVVGTVSGGALTNATNVAFDGTYAYVASASTENTLAVVDVSTPSSPTIAGSVTDSATMPDPVDIAVSNGYAYVVSKSADEIAVVDVSTPSSPTIAGSVTDSTYMDGASSVAVSGNYAYVTGEYSNSLAVVDVSTPSSPTVAGGVIDSTTLENARGVATDGSTAWVTSPINGSLAAVDVSTPSSPSIAGAAYASGGVKMAALDDSGKYVYVSDGGVVRAMNVTTATDLHRVSTAQTGVTGLPALATTGDYVYSGSGADEFLSIYGANPVSGLSVSDDATHSASIGWIESGSSATVEFGVTTSTTSLSWSGSGGTYDWTLHVEERTLTEDPEITVNGGTNTTSHSGQLAAGTTTSLSTDTTWLDLDGTNTVTVTVSDSLSADAPTGQVDVSYSHTATDRQTISYSAEQWTDRYNISKTFASERPTAWANISHTDNVVAVRDLEVRFDQSGGWTAVAASNYYLQGNNLSVDLDAVYGGTIPAGTQVEIRSNGSKISTHNVTITVVEATASGSALNTRIRFESIGEDAHIGVGPTDEGRRVHYLIDETWSNPSEYVVVDSSGAQDLYVPQAEAGALATVRNLSTEVQVDNAGGDVRLSVLSAGSPPRLDISPGPAGSGDNVTFVYHDTTSGNRYELYSASLKETLDTETAQSPVFLAGDDNDAVLEIRLLGSGGGGGAAVSVGTSSNSTPGLITIVAVILSIAGALIVAVVAGRRLGFDSKRQTRLLALVGGVVGFIGFVVVGGGQSLGNALSALSSSSAGVVLIAVAGIIALWALRERIGLPRWVLLVSGLVLGIWTLDQLSGGALSSGLSQVSALIWLVVLFGGVALLYQVVKGRPVKIIAGDSGKGGNQ